MLSRNVERVSPINCHHCNTSFASSIEMDSPSLSPPSTSSESESLKYPHLANRSKYPDGASIYEPLISPVTNYYKDGSHPHLNAPYDAIDSSNTRLKQVKRNKAHRRSLSSNVKKIAFSKLEASDLILPDPILSDQIKSSLRCIDDTLKILRRIGRNPDFIKIYHEISLKTSSVEILGNIKFKNHFPESETENTPIITPLKNASEQEEQNDKHTISIKDIEKNIENVIDYLLLMKENLQKQLSPKNFISYKFIRDGLVTDGDFVRESTDQIKILLQENDQEKEDAFLSERMKRWCYTVIISSISAIITFAFGINFINASPIISSIINFFIASIPAILQEIINIQEIKNENTKENVQYFFKELKSLNDNFVQLSSSIMLHKYLLNTKFQQIRLIHNLERAAQLTVRSMVSASTSEYSNLPPLPV